MSLLLTFPFHFQHFFDSSRTPFFFLFLIFLFLCWFGDGNFRGFVPSGHETVNLAFFVHKSLLAGVKRMAFVAKLHMDGLFGGTGRNPIPAGANYLRVGIILRMNIFFHNKSIVSKFVAIVNRDLSFFRKMFDYAMNGMFGVLGFDEEETDDDEDSAEPKIRSRAFVKKNNRQTNRHYDAKITDGDGD